MNFHIKALSIAATGVIWFVVAITVLAELSAPVKNALAAATGHHWVSKGVLALVVFGVLYCACKFFTADTKDDARPVYVVIGSAVLGGLTIFLFYLWHFLA